ncbi:glutathione S-transferase family protein [Oscillatoria sp. FACHB-1407]|uniref:glutathione S-transferase family protein n=1 Tax=Oscillatoria sp. FACHB-1407 TaxID=2692847 RepID=UPI001682E6C8|nr:glutathione S-transferase family protein [Oscillatoria sp. FACHB-1407]MBD2462800.1 glutathione S-transferase family protein [Oscillatoria sp. FACHB-1407]
MASFSLVIGNKNYSSWSLRAWLTLKQSGLEFTEIRIPLDTPETHAKILEHSPSGRVPVLIHDGLHIWESLAICEYIVEQAPDRQLLPQDPKARAIARAVSSEMHAGFRALREHMPMDCRSRYPGEGRKPGVQDDINRITQLWRDTRQQFGAGGDFLFGQFTYADAMYAPVVSRFVTYGVSLDPVAQAYADAIWALPTMRQWLADAEAEVEVIEAHTL